MNRLKSEDTEQMAVINWAFYQTGKYPELKWLFHCPNGGSRNQREAVKLKRMGVKRGVSDLCLPYPKGIYCGLFIEMKYGKNSPTVHQQDFMFDMAEAGHYTAVCYGAEAAIEIIKEYLSLEKGQKMSRENKSLVK
ncbi:MAG: VRR-NUC domain-containing protein [Lachnospiraceae bacterium]|nr:VRR-NUC domain-containing protein [Lachnospiraceae bacterium]